LEAATDASALNNRCPDAVAAKLTIMTVCFCWGQAIWVAVVGMVAVVACVVEALPLPVDGKSTGTGLMLHLLAWCIVLSGAAASVKEIAAPKQQGMFCEW
jgi:hypothetical protein